MIEWAYFPRSAAAPALVLDLVDLFRQEQASIDSHRHKLESNHVLNCLRPGLHRLGFDVETGKSAGKKVRVPVLYGNRGEVSKAFDADAHHRARGFVLEVEAGRAVVNNQFLKDLFQACMMEGVTHLGIAVRQVYGTNRSLRHDFDTVVTFMDTLYASQRLKLPLQGVLIVGY
ncbi:MAG: hypothetical protein O2819_04545 [Planctomycetota bacterium]|nr:hypothetical protein [Planctomycetota bacterium]